jgi:hypothetical protein
MENRLLKIVYIGNGNSILERYKIYEVVYTEFSYYLLKLEGISIPYGVYKKDCISLEEWREIRINKILNEEYE